MKIKNIIFDLGGVILLQPKELMYTVLNEVFSVKINEAYKLWNKHKNKTIVGEMTSEELINIFKKELELNESTALFKEKLKQAYKKHVAIIDKKILSYVKELKKNYKVYLLTDTIDLHDSYNKTRNIYPLFDKTFKSFEEHLRKPDRRAFLNLLTKINAKPEESLFIDDLKENILAAKQLGAHGIVYKNFEQLTEDMLKEYEIKT